MALALILEIRVPTLTQTQAGEERMWCSFFYGLGDYLSCDVAFCHACIDQEV